MKIELIKHIYTRSDLFRGKNPSVIAYFATTGRWNDDSALLTRIEKEKALIQDRDMFSNVSFTPVDASKIQKLYSYANNNVVQKIIFEHKITMPQTAGIKEAYIGTIKILEILKLIQDDSGNIIKGLFYDNVRDYQGENEVNAEIKKTINSQDKDLFAFLNNGITIVSDKISKTGNEFTLEGYQVVNGCQTCHVLFENRSKITENMYVSVKFIVCDDFEIRNKIVKSTNRQTTVKDEELIALTDFQKELEQYYLAQPESFRLYYERRSRQFNSESDIEKNRIISISTQIRSFSAMFNDKPQYSSRYYATLLNLVDKNIFLKDHKLISYYISAFALYKLESLFRKKQINEKYKAFRYFLLMILRIQVGGSQMPAMTANDFERYCESIRAVLIDTEKCLQAFRNATKFLDTVLSNNFDRDKARSSQLVTEIKRKLNKGGKSRTVAKLS